MSILYELGTPLRGIFSEPSENRITHIEVKNFGVYHLIGLNLETGKESIATGIQDSLVNFSKIFLIPINSAYTNRIRQDIYDKYTIPCVKFTYPQLTDKQIERLLYVVNVLGRNIPQSSGYDSHIIAIIKTVETNDIE